MRSTMTLIPSSLVFAAMLLAGIPTGNAQERILGGVPQVLPIKPVKIADGDNELQRLLKERYNATVAELKDLYALYGGGRAPVADVCRAIEKFAQAGSELAETPVARVSELELARDAARAVESITTSKHEEGNEPRHVVEHSKICRLGIEIDLVRAREAAKAAREPK